ncbi:uncharacterized protein LOC131154017 isoform X2 [Malania oleifera]|uniref:uncharacterized protein LOC131154017 isoform X2 n=1 Tax=Malania oleifera TaxID=397392 RepID=UPI0025AE4325|nr:uncharacterized protein LOC131154017 isoform X2 [Malania oleifera]
MFSTRNPGVASWRLMLVGSFLLFSSCPADSSSAAAGGGAGKGGGEGGGCSIEWQILTKRNFSSQIGLHSHVLLMVTVPWSGESRSLMKELAHAVTRKQEKFGALKLMLVYRNSEKMLVDAIDATDEITILFYHYSMSFKYKGRLRAQNILSSARYLISLLPEELPLKTLSTQEDLVKFLDSTDKAILFFEFCGWTPILLAKRTENAFGMTGVSGMGFNGEVNRTFTLQQKKKQKGIENKNMNCGVENKFSGNWLRKFSSANRSAPCVDAENKRPDVGLCCTFEEFQHFDSFFSKFLTAAQEFFLPPERQRFGLISDRSLLTSLGVGDSASWLAMIYFVGCPSCSKILKENDDFKDALQMHNSFVLELEGDGLDLDPALPANRPSILLFVDRSSESSKIRRKSKEALKVFRELVVHNQISYQMAGKNNDKPEKSTFQGYQVSTSSHGPCQLELSPTSQKAGLKDTISIMIINEGGHVALDNIASDVQSNSLQKILEYVLQHKKEAKLKSPAKEVGFQLLSNDFDIKIADMLPSPIEDVQLHHISSDHTVENHVNHVDLNNDELLPTESISAREHEQSKHTSIGSSSQYSEEKRTVVDSSAQVISLESDCCDSNDELTNAEDVRVEQPGLPEVDCLREQQQSAALKGSFFFSDGSYRLVRALTAGSKIPSVVIIDPISNRHYVFPEHTVFSYSALVNFLDGFRNGSLIPYQRSETLFLKHREVKHPPFVNLDFHEADSIPRVTAHTFSEMVLGSNQSDSQNAGNAWKKDVLVLFSNSWCGFCQRMELVVREVYRALKGYMNKLKNASEKGEFLFSCDNLEEFMLRLPLIYLMDCTLNDCSLILKSLGQVELYPSLLLFPAERKSVVSYEGDMAATSIMEFIVHHGNDFHSKG